VKNYRINSLLLLLFLLGTASEFSQGNRHPRVEIPGEVRSKEPFVVQIVSGERPITFCQRINVSIPTPSGIEDAPRPVDVEKLDTNKRWVAYTANLPDIGVAFSAVSVGPHQHRNFLYRVESPGDYRFTLRYLEANEPTTCPNPGKSQKKVFSQTLHVRQ
jgi:hypothetical protein